MALRELVNSTRAPDKFVPQVKTPLGTIQHLLDEGGWWKHLGGKGRCALEPIGTLGLGTGNSFRQICLPKSHLLLQPIFLESPEPPLLGLPFLPLWHFHYISSNEDNNRFFFFCICFNIVRIQQQDPSCSFLLFPDHPICRLYSAPPHPWGSCQKKFAENAWAPS